MLDIGGEVRSWQGFETLSVITGLRVEKAAELKLLSDPPPPFQNHGTIGLDRFAFEIRGEAANLLDFT